MKTVCNSCNSNLNIIIFGDGCVYCTSCLQKALNNYVRSKGRLSFFNSKIKRVNGHRKINNKSLCVCGGKMFHNKDHSSGWVCEKEMSKK